MADVARPDGARSALVESLSLAGNAAKKCLFCELSEKNVVIFTTTFWKVFYSIDPYPGTQHHIMMASQEHVLDFRHLSDAAKLDYFGCIERLEDELGFYEGSLITRFGTPGYNASTIYHLHAHLVRSDRLPVTEERIMSFLLHEFAELARKKKLTIDPDRCAQVTMRWLKGHYLELRAEAPGVPPLEYVNIVTQGYDAMRAMDRREAWPIRAKVSQGVDPRSSEALE